MRKNDFCYKRLESDDKNQRTVKERISDNYNAAAGHVSHSFNAVTERVRDGYKPIENLFKKQRTLPEDKERLLKKEWQN